jgi:Peptidase family M23
MKGLALLLPVLVALQVGVQPALAWAWPVDGPVLRPFVLGDDPYAGGQHRGVDIGATAGASVRAPASGTVSFAGTVPTGGKTVTIQTDDGYAVTLLHLGAFSVSRAAQVREGDFIGAVGPSGEPAEAEPYVYLGIRIAGDPNGYVDPLALLPGPAPVDDSARPEPAPDPAPSPHSAGGGKGHAEPSSTHSASGAQAAAPKDAGAVAASAGASGSAAGRPRAQGSRPRRTQASPRLDASVTPSAREPAAGAGFSPQAAAQSGRAPSEPFPRAWALAAVAAACALGMVAALVRRRGELGDARAAHGPAAMLFQGASAAAEDTGRLRLRQEDHVVLDRDLEGVLLPELEALADLDRNDDPAKVVDVADDSRSRCPSGRANWRDSLACSVRPHGFLESSRLRRTLGASPRTALSNHHFGVLGRRATFV